MKRSVLVLAALALLALPFARPIGASNAQDKNQTAHMVSYNEVPAVSSPASGTFGARIVGDQVEWTLSYADLEGNVTQSHIHLGQRGVNGGISVFLCSNLGNGPAGTAACPPSPATISGVFDADDVIGPTGQGIAATEFGELVDAIRAGVTYANVHTSKFPGGEIRGQLD